MIHIPDAPYIRRAGWEPEAPIACRVCDDKLTDRQIEAVRDMAWPLCADCQSWEDGEIEAVKGDVK